VGTMYEQDYIMRLVRDLVRFIARTFLHKDDVEYNVLDEENLSQSDLLHKQIIVLLKQGRINEAENMLFEELDVENAKYLELAIDFYNRLNEMDDEFLEDNNFSRQEVEEGLKEVIKRFGITI